MSDIPISSNKKMWWILISLMLAFLTLSQIGAKQLFLGSFIAVVGYIIVWQTEWIVYNAGRIPFAERFFRTAGGSRFMYRVIGTLIIVWGFLMATDQEEPVIKWVVETFFRVNVK